MKQKLCLGLCFVFTIVILVAGCAPTMTVPVTRPAEVNLRGINKIAIGEIKGNGEQEITDLLTSKLFESGKFEVVDRANLDKIVKEHKINLSGAIDEKTAAKMGKLVGAAVLVFGNVSLYKTEQKNTVGQPWVDKQGYRHQSHFKTVTAKATVSLQVVGLTTGTVLAAKTISQQAEQSTSADNGWPEDPDKDIALNEAREKTVAAFIKMIAPYTDYVTVTFAPNDSKLPELERGVNFAKVGRWKDAIEQFKSATQKNPVHDGAWYDLGLAYEYSFMFKEAEEALNEAIKIKPSSQEYFQEIGNVKRLAAERKKLETQGALGPK